MMKSNREILINKLESLPLLDERYQNITCVNFDGNNGKKRGQFSLVFKAHDQLENRDVALKFFDPDPSVMQDQYRLAAFEREPELLVSLLGKNRCLQLVSNLHTFNLEIEIQASRSVATIPCKYFAVNWIPQELDVFFERQHEVQALDKLHLFNEIVLGVEALHRHEVFHRDLKADNLRAYVDAIKRIVVAIDLGTAARFDSGNLIDQYSNPVGHLKYSAPEAFCGLAGHRKIAALTDIWALGCLLFELFNKDLFATHFHRSKRNMIVLASLAIQLGQHSEIEQKVLAWRTTIKQLQPTFDSVVATVDGHSVPIEIQNLLNEMICSMTRFDFAKRLNDFQIIRAKIWSMIRTIENKTSQQRAIARKRQFRKTREEKALIREQRLNDYLTHSRQLLC